ncbi:MAG: DUF4382 domain-containing protein [Nitrososphaerota archaeon]|nr:DUF4382 domain-containing protein [Nitrososphaerota archaeon]MDG7024837.1 DUF4382 domain-containing protein [Nitrososphaerota archaeon]
MKASVAMAAAVVVVVVALGVVAALFLMSPSGYLVVGVTDAPSTGSVTHIYLTITDLTLQGSGNSSTSYRVNSTTFDLLELTNVTRMLGKNSVPAGNYTMIRFSVTNAVATVSGTNETLTVPSGEIKVPFHFTVASGKTTAVVLDISADMTAISTSGNLRPTVTGLETSAPS